MNENSGPMYRVGLIGCGRKGTGHARGYMLNPATEVVAAADTDPENLELFCKRAGVPGYSSYQEMLRKERIDIAAPVLPVSVNPEVVIGCAKGGVKAIFSEKPISASLQEADEMVEECRSRGIPFACGDAWRNLPQFWQFKDMIDSGEVGDVQSINVYHPHSEISGGGCQSLGVTRMFADDADVDWAVGWVAGDPFDEEDQGMGGTLRFKNGVEAFIHHREVGRKGIEVLTTDAVFFSDWTTFKLWKVPDGADDRTAKLSELEEQVGLFPDAGGGERTYDAEGWRETGFRQKASIEALLEAMESGAEPKTSGHNMRKVLEIGIALRESHRRGHAPVKLPIEDRSMKILPHQGRWLNKKEVYGKEWYDDAISAHKAD